MNVGRIHSLLAGIGLPVAYDHFAEGEAPGPPFLCFRTPQSANTYADDTVWQPACQLDVELYTDTKQPDAERLVEAVLDQNGLPWSKSETWIPSERLYEVLYQTQFIQTD